MTRIALLAVLASACGGGNSTPDAALPPPPDAAGPTGISGTVNDRFLSGGGIAMDMVDLRSMTPMAATATVVYAGTGNVDGTFEVPLVPAGEEFTLTNVGTNPLTTRARQLDLGLTILGRTDQAAATGPTTLAITATNMDPWTTGDFIEVYSAGADAIAFGTNGDGSFVAGEPTSGATSLSNATFDWLAQGGGMIEGGKGDTALLLHLHQTNAGGTAYFALTRSVTISSLQMSVGGGNMFSAAFADAPTVTDTFAWKRSQLAAHLAETGENADNGQFLNVVAQPQAATAGWTSGSELVAPDLMNVIVPAGTTADATVGPLAYGDPVPELDKIVVFGTSSSHHYQLPGTTMPFADRAALLGIDLKSSAATGGVAPIVTPPRQLTIDGAPATGDLTLASLTPTVAWQAPAVGTPTLYSVVVRRIGSSGNATVLLASHRFNTADTSLTIPRGVLASGNTYTVRVTARDSAGHDLSQAPSQFLLPYGEADATSGILTAP